MDINTKVAFAQNATKSSISEDVWVLGWVEVVGGVNGVPTAQQFNEVCYIIDEKANLAFIKASSALAAATKAQQDFSGHKHNISEISDFPTSLPANGGTAALARGVHSGTGKVSIWEDEEGGNISLTSADGTKRVEMDLSGNDKFRMYFTVGNVHDTTAFVYDFASKKMLIRGELYGNADTVDGLHADAFLRWTTDTLDGDILTWASAQTVPTCISKISNIGTTPTDSPFSDGNTEAIYFVYMLSGGRKLVHCYAYHYSNDFTSSVHFTRVVTGNAWSSGWRNVADGGNADTLDGLHSSSLLQNLGYLEIGDIRAYAMSATSGSVFVSPDVTNTPSPSWWFISIDKPQGTHILLRAIDITTALAYRASYNASTDTWTDWLKENDGGNADTLDGLHSSELITGSTFTRLTSSINDCYTAGTYSVEAAYTPDFPQGYGSYGLLDVRRYGSIAFHTIKFDSGVIINRATVIGQTNWTEWAKVNDGGNANTVQGIDGYHIGTFSESGSAHASGAHLMYCQYNLFGDGRFGIGVPDFEIRVDYANGATKATYADSVADTPSNVCLRNISAGTSDMTAGSTALATGDIYLVYE